MTELGFEAIDRFGGETIKSGPIGVLLEMGSQSEEALKRMFEDLGVNMVSMSGDTPAEELEGFDVVVSSGGANSVHDQDAPEVDSRIFGANFDPLVIGVCLSAQLMVHHNGGVVTPSHQSENGRYGNLDVDVVDNGAAGGFVKLKQGKFVHSNGDHFDQNGLPAHFKPTAMTGDHVAAFVDTETGNVGFQFHPELSDVMGYGVVRNILKHRGLDLETKSVDVFDQIVREINERAEGDDLIVGFSGGIDSNVIAEAVLASDIAKDKVHIVHFDFGVNRTENGVPESEALLDRFEQRTGVRPDFIQIDPERVFSQPVTLVDEDGNSQGEYVLSEQLDSELKRKVFAQIYANAFTDYVSELGLDPDHTKLVQGTLYPDVIESLGKGKVKTHHNQSPFMVYLQKTGRTIDPAKRLFKDDMRRVGREREFEEVDWQRQPFPGPGLIPRIICSDGEPILPENADEVWQRARDMIGDDLGVVLGGFRTVGQKGDKRSYAWPLLLSGEPDWERMAMLTEELGNAFPGEINRVYHITGERADGVSTSADMTETFINNESLDQLRVIDDEVTQLLRYCGALAVTDQVPIGLLPSPFRPSNSERAVFLRPFRTPRSNSFLNGEAVRPDQDKSIALWYEQVSTVALQQPGIARVAYDLTNKPFGSTEAE